MINGKHNVTNYFLTNTRHDALERASIEDRLKKPQHALATVYTHSLLLKIRPKELFSSNKEKG